MKQQRITDAADEIFRAVENLHAAMRRRPEREHRTILAHGDALSAAAARWHDRRPILD